MTAIVGVLNRNGVAIAADSAATLGNTHKVINNANKIFALSKFHPVAVMTYNCSEFMGVPWEIIIKTYRNGLKGRSFPRLADYADDFIKFVRDLPFLHSLDDSVDIVLERLHILYSYCIETLEKEKGVKEQALTEEDLAGVLKKCISNFKNRKAVGEFKKYQLSEFRNKYTGDIEDYVKKQNWIWTPLIVDAVYYHMASPFNPEDFTGIVFTGYGDDDIFPSLLEVRFYFSLQDCLKYDVGRLVDIDKRERPAAIMPFAQTDVIQNIIGGAHPGFLQIVDAIVKKSIFTIRDVICNTIRKAGKDKALAEKIENLDYEALIDRSLQDMNESMFSRYSLHLYETISELNKEDLANMAESFISLTSLIRRMSPGEETVGGPVDVAVISKGDGLIWMKRKHYFDPDLNSRFFANYYES